MIFVVVLEHYGVLSGQLVLNRSCSLTGFKWKKIKVGAVKVTRNLDGKSYKGESTKFCV